MTHVFAKAALTPSGWRHDVRIIVGEHGRITSIESETDSPGAKDSVDLLLPGVPNLHSHAFQRALAGRTEYRSHSSDDFWGWRKRMYELVGQLTPQQFQAIVQLAFIEMLEAGYTSVAEFHYLHTLPSHTNAPCGDLSKWIIDLAKTAGIRLTLLPVLYEHSHFDRSPSEGIQASFVMAFTDFRALVGALRDCEDTRIRIGTALHSLRAVRPESVQELANWKNRPVHIHLSEQPREVQDCKVALGMRPVEWMLNRIRVSEDWCFVHSTHTTSDERMGMAEAGVTVALCPSTEANLGDGIFDAVDFQSRNGVFGIGSDSQVCIDPLEELRWLEYGQRLQRGERHLLTRAGGRTGAHLFRNVTQAGRNALGQPVGEIAVGSCADFIVPDTSQASLLNLKEDELLDALVFAPTRRAIKHVMVGGEWVVRNGEHALRAKALSDYRQALS